MYHSLVWNIQSPCNLCENQKYAGIHRTSPAGIPLVRLSFLLISDNRTSEISNPASLFIAELISLKIKVSLLHPWSDVEANLLSNGPPQTTYSMKLKPKYNCSNMVKLSLKYVTYDKQMSIFQYQLFREISPCVQTRPVRRVHGAVKCTQCTLKFGNG